MRLNERLKREGLFIQIASLMAQRGTCGRLQVGAVAVFDKRTIASGYNGPLKGEVHCTGLSCNLNEPCTRAIHAEANLISFAAKEGIALKGSTIYCTHQPCLKCAELIISSGIVEVCYLNSYRIEDGLNLLRNNNIKITKLDEQGNTKPI